MPRNRVMDMKKDKNQTDRSVDEYIAEFPSEVRQILLKLRSVIKQAAPQAKEKISYRIPAYEYNGPLVYFAAYAGHIGFYSYCERGRGLQRPVVGV